MFKELKVLNFIWIKLCKRIGHTFRFLSYISLGRLIFSQRLVQLRLLAYAVIWLNPHSGKPGYAPIQTGIQACLPHLDRMVAGHSLATYAELLEVMADV